MLIPVEEVQPTPVVEQDTNVLAPTLRTVMPHVHMLPYSAEDISGVWIKVCSAERSHLYCRRLCMQMSSNFLASFAFLPAVCITSYQAFSSTR